MYYLTFSLLLLTDHVTPRFIKLGIEANKSRLKELLADVQQDSIKTIAKHLIDHEVVGDGVTLLLLSGFDQTQCSAILQSVL